MTEEKLLTVRDVAYSLGISEKEVLNLSESGVIPAYKVGGVYLRFKREQIEEYKKINKSLLHKDNSWLEYPFADRLQDFFYFNDFYIFSFIIIILIVFIIFKG
ncbi:MAG: helix-turn-helix domain-containing protein [Candidatus Omnitrophota bacterium]|nr:helix-turn-helix domain-containing protein [Candidatus Omnitrophota bacterium]MBU1928398.1 helix-turn-helix domain-containing protein [Candidatus Omnitrophota bacterium]MBU2035707.1 helix-turn-helix domain-containing protein [Candidatus Omnitrophota bacterium]MBU2258656.1 helix-turn-helix domain-containing protein [Candidatus Omnitrophota bacterium]